MDLVSRAQGIILKPKDEWEKIKKESTPVGQLFTSYAVLLALIPAIAQFIGYGLIGYRVPFIGWVRFGIGNALIRSVVYYISTLVVVYVFGLIINALAPSFSSKPSAENAMKIAVFSMTPVWVAGILYIIPFLWFLVLLASLYGIYILYLGFAAPLMETPKDKVVSYLLVSIVAIVVLMIIVSVVLGAIFTVGGVYRTL
ncbi:MAG: Yip1 family protein [Candidatus Aminicenantales bacterium]